MPKENQSANTQAHFDSKNILLYKMTRLLWLTLFIHLCLSSIIETRTMSENGISTELKGQSKIYNPNSSISPGGADEEMSPMSLLPEGVVNSWPKLVHLSRAIKRQQRSSAHQAASLSQAIKRQQRSSAHQEASLRRHRSIADSIAPEPSLREHIQKTRPKIEFVPKSSELEPNLKEEAIFVKVVKKDAKLLNPASLEQLSRANKTKSSTHVATVDVVQYLSSLASQEKESDPERNSRIDIKTGEHETILNQTANGDDGEFSTNISTNVLNIELFSNDDDAPQVRRERKQFYSRPGYKKHELNGRPKTHPKESRLAGFLNRTNPILIVRKKVTRVDAEPGKRWKDKVESDGSHSRERGVFPFSAALSQDDAIHFSHRLQNTFSAGGGVPQTYQIDSSPFSSHLNAKYETSSMNVNLPQSTVLLQDHLSSHRRYPSPFAPPASTPSPSFDTTTPINVSAQHGSNAFLLCRIRNLSNQSVSWIRTRDSHIISVDQMTFIADERFHVYRESESGIWSLQIKYVQARDEGTYECQVSSEPKISHFVHFKVITPVVRIPTGPDLHVQLGDTVTLKCVISAVLHHPSYIFWYQNGERVGGRDSAVRRITEETETRDATIATLLIPHASAADAGNYTCAPDSLPTAAITLHVINGEHPAAMQHGTSVTTCQASSLLLFMMLSLVWLCCASRLHDLHHSAKSYAPLASWNRRGCKLPTTSNLHCTVSSRNEDCTGKSSRQIDHMSCSVQGGAEYQVATENPCQCFHVYAQTGYRVSVTRHHLGSINSLALHDIKEFIQYISIKFACFRFKLKNFNGDTIIDRVTTDLLCRLTSPEQ